MAEERTYQGQTYRREGPGQPWVRVGVPAPVTMGQPRSTAQFDVPQAQADLRRTEVQTAADAAGLPYAGSKAQADAARAQADAERARAEADAAIKEQANAPDPAMARVRQELQTDNVLANINAARRQVGEGWSTGNVAGAGWFQGLPFVGQNSTDLSASLSGIEGAVINDTLKALKAESASGASGYGSLTQREADRLAAAVAALQQTQDSGELLRNLARVERHYRNSLALLNGEDPRLPEVAEKYGIVTGGDEPNAAAGGALTSEGRWQGDPALRGVNATVRDMIRRGRSAEDIRGYLNAVQPGLGDRAQNLDRAVAAVRQNPEREFNVDLEKQWMPNSGLTETLGDIGMSPVGAAAIGAADVASMGFLDNLTSNPELTRATMAGVSEENPTSYLLGQIGGGIGTGLGMEGLLARGGLTGIRGARAGDAAFGAGYGAGMADEPDDSRIAAALLGAGGGVAGGAAGRALGRGAGRAIAGVSDAAQRTLYDAGIRMTPGQILGGGAKATEDRLAGLPVVGDAIRARRAEGIEDFNRAAFDEALAPIGATPTGIGGAGIDAARQARSDAYTNALSGVQVNADQQFTNDIAQLLARSGTLPATMADNASTSLALRIGEPMGQTGTLSGEGIQQVYRGLRRDARSVENQPFGYDVAQILRGGEDALTGMVDRQAPGVTEALANANRANMNVETLRAAVNAARNQGEVFTPAQLSTAASQSARRFGNNQGTTNQPFYSLTRPAQEILPSTIPDSGTAGRLVLPALVGGAAGGGSFVTADGETAERAGSGATTAVVAGLLAAAPYSRTARDTIMELLMRERPQAVSRVGERLIDRADIAGILARQQVVEELPR